MKLRRRLLANIIYLWYNSVKWSSIPTSSHRRSLGLSHLHMSRRHFCQSENSGQNEEVWIGGTEKEHLILQDMWTYNLHGKVQNVLNTEPWMRLSSGLTNRCCCCLHKVELWVNHHPRWDRRVGCPHLKETKQVLSLPIQPVGWLNYTRKE